MSVRHSIVFETFLSLSVQGGGDVFDATPCMPALKDLCRHKEKLRETCSIWTIVNIVRKLRNPKMVMGTPGFLSRAVLNHDAGKVSSVLSCLGLGMAISTLATADSAKVEVLAEQDIKVDPGDMVIGGFDNMVHYMFR